MRRIKEVLRLRALLGENVTAIASGAGLARSTVRSYLQRVDRAALGGMAALEEMTDEALEAALFPHRWRRRLNARCRTGIMLIKSCAATSI